MPDSRNQSYYSSKSTSSSQPEPEMQDLIAEKCDSIKELLISKNKKYGNSATSPLRIFSNGGPLEGLLVRCDDKLSRIKTTGLTESGEDQVIDLIGYLILISIQTDLEIK